MTGYRLVLAHGYSCVLCVSCNMITRIIIEKKKKRSGFCASLVPRLSPRPDAKKKNGGGEPGTDSHVILWHDDFAMH